MVHINMTDLLQQYAIGNGKFFKLFYPLFEEFWKHCVLSGGTQRTNFTTFPERRNENINMSFPRVGIESEKIFADIRGVESDCK